MDQNKAFFALTLIKKALAGVRWWIDCGTLLGAVRDNDIIAWDFDIDINCIGEDRNHIEDIARKLRSFGFIATVNKCWKGNPNVEFIQFSRDGIPGHIAFHWLKGTRDYHFERLVNELAPTRKIRGVDFPVPVDPEIYLSKIYKNWKVVDKTDSAHAYQMSKIKKG